MSDYLEHGGIVDEGDDFIGGELDDDAYMDEKGYMSKYQYY